MTHKALNTEWTPEEIVTVRHIVTNGTGTLSERIKFAAKEVNRTFSSVNQKWYKHIKNIKASEDVVVKPEESKTQFLQARNVLAFIDMKGKIHLVKEDAINSNVHYILEEMESADNLYEYIVNNWDKLEYIKKNA